jgi:hypothetical protein
MNVVQEEEYHSNIKGIGNPQNSILIQLRFTPKQKGVYPKGQIGLKAA